VTRVPSADRTTRVLVAVVLVLNLASAAGQVSKYVFDHGRLGGLVPLLFVGHPRSVPTWFLSSCLLVCALLFGTTAGEQRRAGAPDGGRWVALSLLLAFLSLDEATGLRRIAVRALASHGAGLLAAGAGVAVIAVAFARVVAGLPAETRRPLLLAGAIYAAGALGLELLALAGRSSRLVHHPLETPAFATAVSVARLAEMLAAVLCIRALLSRAERA